MFHLRDDLNMREVNMEMSNFGNMGLATPPDPSFQQKRTTTTKCSKLSITSNPTPQRPRHEEVNMEMSNFGNMDCNSTRSY